MEPLWSPVVANGGNRRQIEASRKPQKQAKTVATGCHPLPENFHGKEGVDGSSPSEGSAKRPHASGFAIRLFCRASTAVGMACPATALQIAEDNGMRRTSLCAAADAGR